MGITEIYDDITAKYPAVITTEQMMEICGICKKTAYNLKKSGIVPYKAKPSPDGLRHEIKLADVLEYLFYRDFYPSATNAAENYYYAVLDNWPDVLSVLDITEITGYCKTAVNNWILSRKLQAIRIGRKNYIPRPYLLEFLSSAQYHNIRVKSDSHLKAIMCYSSQ